MRFNKIGIVGQGFVGSAVREGLKNNFSIETYDIDKRTTCNSLKDLFYKSDVIFLCLPTPMTSDGTCYLGILTSVLSELDDIGAGKTIVIKSTIPPGTTDRFNTEYKNLDIVFNPEFLTEANYIEDYKNQNRIILGGPRPATTEVKTIFDVVFPTIEIIKTSATIAETIKYVTNCFLATKVSFANEMYQLCEKLDIDYDKVIEYAKHDERLGATHWNVPGPDGDYGYGGHCFPKDMWALYRHAHKLDLELSIISSAISLNNQVRKNRDWEKQIGRAVI